MSRFFKVLLIYILGHQMASSMFRMIAGLCRTMIVSNSLGSIVLTGVYCLGGFIIPRSRFKKWWIWGYWISPLTWSMIGVSENEFLSPKWDHQVCHNYIIFLVKFDDQWRNLKRICTSVTLKNIWHGRNLFLIFVSWHLKFWSESRKSAAIEVWCAFGGTLGTGLVATVLYVCKPYSPKWRLKHNVKQRVFQRVWFLRAALDNSKYLEFEWVLIIRSV